MKDSIIQEVWDAKAAIAEKFNHDVRLLVEHLRKKEKSSTARVVDLRAIRKIESQRR